MPLPYFISTHFLPIYRINFDAGLALRYLEGRSDLVRNPMMALPWSSECSTPLRASVVEDERLERCFGSQAVLLSF
jgi:hypothetical protein